MTSRGEEIPMGITQILTVIGDSPMLPRADQIRFKQRSASEKIYIV